MMKLKDIDVLKKAIEINGADYQMSVAIEEMSELQKEICKMKRNKGNVQHLAEEIADVEIVIEELKFIMNNDDLVEQYKKQKIERLKEKLSINYQY